MAAPSRSALGRHVKHVDEVAAELLQHRSLAEALIERGLNLDDSRTARLNIALAQTVLAKLMLTDDGGLVQLNPKDAAFLAAGRLGLQRFVFLSHLRRKSLC